jgi:hypothetical protein
LTDPEGIYANFPDWDNPEDGEGAPEGYYDEDYEEEDEDYVPDETDPDYDLSEAASYSGYEPSTGEGPIPQWVITAMAVAVVLAIVLGLILALR